MWPPQLQRSSLHPLRRGGVTAHSFNKQNGVFFGGGRGSKERFLVLNLVKSNSHSKRWEYAQGLKLKPPPLPI